MAKMEQIVEAVEAAMGPPMLERGTYITPWTYLGAQWIFNVDHRHDVTRMEPVSAPEHRDAQWRDFDGAGERRSCRRRRRAPCGLGDAPADERNRLT